MLSYASCFRSQTDFFRSELSGCLELIIAA